MATASATRPCRADSSAIVSVANMVSSMTGPRLSDAGAGRQLFAVYPGAGSRRKVLVLARHGDPPPHVDGTPCRGGRGRWLRGRPRRPGLAPPLAGAGTGPRARPGGPGVPRALRPVRPHPAGRAQPVLADGARRGGAPRLRRGQPPLAGAVLG